MCLPLDRVSLVNVTGRLCGSDWLGSSVVECLLGKQETVGLSLGQATFFFCPCDIWWPVWVCEQQRDCFVGSGMVPCGFGDKSNYAGGKCNRSIVWLSSSVEECLHGKRETLGSSPGRATFFYHPCDTRLTSYIFPLHN